MLRFFRGFLLNQPDFTDFCRISSPSPAVTHPISLGHCSGGMPSMICGEMSGEMYESGPVVCTRRRWIFLPSEDPKPMEAMDRTVSCACGSDPGIPNQ